jgi:hypothetical protein
MPGATTLNMKNIVKSAHLVGKGAKYKDPILYCVLIAGANKLIKMPYVGINNGRKTHENKCESPLIILCASLQLEFVIVLCISLPSF